MLNIFWIHKFTIKAKDEEEKGELMFKLGWI